MFLLEGNGDTYRGVIIEKIARLHEAMIAVRTAYTHREYPFVALDIDVVKPFSDLINSITYLGGADMQEIVAVRDYYRPQGTSSQAVHGLQRELPVRSSMTDSNTQLFYKLRCYLGGSSNMTGRALADRYGVFASGLEGERAIERGNSVYVHKGATRLLGYFPQGVLRQIIILGLDFFENGNEPLVFASTQNIFCIFNFHGDFPIPQSPIRCIFAGGPEKFVAMVRMISPARN